MTGRDGHWEVPGGAKQGHWKGSARPLHRARKGTLRVPSEEEREKNPAVSDPPDNRNFIHQCNNLLGGILNGVALLRRARNEKDRTEAIAFIEDAALRAQAHLGTLGAAQFAPPTGNGRPCPPATEPAVKRTVLVAEDDELNRHL